MAIKEIIHDNKAVAAKRTTNGLETSFVEVFGTAQILVGVPGSTPTTNRAALMYDLRQRIFHNGVLPLDLETGGPNDDALPGAKKNWFPGCYAYGISLNQDAPVYRNEDGTGTILAMLWKPDANHPVQKATAKILTVLDDVNTNPKWKASMNIYYYVEAPNGARGYVNSQLINKIVYRDN